MFTSLYFLLKNKKKLFNIKVSNHEAFLNVNMTVRKHISVTMKTHPTIY